jgi:spore germination protein KA
MKKSIKRSLIDIFAYKRKPPYEFSLPETSPEEKWDRVYDQEDNSIPNPTKIETRLSSNLDYVKAEYNLLINSDIEIREFSINIGDIDYSDFLLYVDGIVDSNAINEFIIEPLMIGSSSKTRKSKQTGLPEYIINHLIPQIKVVKKDNFEDAFAGVNIGDCAIFIDSLDCVLMADTKGGSNRGVSAPINEKVIRGAQQGFVENIRTNTAIIRRIINSEDLIIESLKVGKISKTSVVVCYMGKIASNDLVSEVKYRINNLDIDYLISSRSVRKSYSG